MASKDYSHVPPQKKTRPASRMSDPTLLLYPSSPFGLSCIHKFDLVLGRVVRVLVVSLCSTLPRFSKSCLLALLCACRVCALRQKGDSALFYVLNNLNIT